MCGGGGSRSRHDTATPQSVKYHIYYDIFQGSQVNTGYGRDGGEIKIKIIIKNLIWIRIRITDFERDLFCVMEGGGGRRGRGEGGIGIGRLGDWELGLRSGLGIGNWELGTVRRFGTEQYIQDHA